MTHTDLLNFLRTRRSIRKFKSTPVPDSVIERILDTARYAPSAHDLQPWRFVHVRNFDTKDHLGTALTTKMRKDLQDEGTPKEDIESRAERSLRRIDEAPVIMLLCRDMSAVRKERPEEITMAVQSIGAVGLQLLLAAHAEGLAGNWICWPLYAQQAVRQALELPETWDPQAMFFLGYADEQPSRKRLRSIDEMATTR